MRQVSAWARRALLPVGVSLLLASCGGGDSGNSGAAPNASGPTPTPSPTATGGLPKNLSQTPFLFGQSTAQQFAVFGFMVAAQGGAWEDVPDPASLNDTIDLGVRMPAANSLALRIGSYGEGTIILNGGGGYSQNGVTQIGFNVLDGSGSLTVAYGPGDKPLASVAIGFWERVARNSGEFPLDQVSFVYGLPTAANQVPTAGIREYSSAQDAPGITIDFASRSVTGSFKLAEKIYAVTDCTLPSGQTGFSCRLVPVDGSAEGRLDVQLAGTGAREMLGRAVVSAAAGKAEVLLALGAKS
jgi:hypothetical protein